MAKYKFSIGDKNFIVSSPDNNIADCRAAYLKKAHPDKTGKEFDDFVKNYDGEYPEFEKLTDCN